jgi:hypothetical protein
MHKQHAVSAQEKPVPLMLENAAARQQVVRDLAVQHFWVSFQKMQHLLALCTVGSELLRGNRIAVSSHNAYQLFHGC